MTPVSCEHHQPREACGVFGVYAPGFPVAQLTYFGLYALQHRGQESAGMAVSDGDAITVVKDMGLVTNVFDERTLAPLQGDLAIGHVRYSTTGASTWGNAQPIYRPAGGAGFTLGHNGNLVNTTNLAAAAGAFPGTIQSDSELVAELLHAEIVATGGTLVDALPTVLPQLEGAFSLVLMDEDHVIGVRDPHGFRPLCLGRLDGGWVLASETTALDIVGAHLVREVDPGEMVVIDGSGLRSMRPFAVDRVSPRLCLFEFVYFARPDSQLYGQTVHSARQRMGELLAEQAPLPKDTHPDPRPAMVMPVPESGIPAAEGYARRSGIPFGHGLVKNRYIGRTFIAPSQAKRAQGVRVKLNPIRENIAGKRLVVVDDSIVRGTTQQALVVMLREAGAAEVHLRISSPPYRWPCFFGMDTGSQSELLAADLTVSEVRDYIGCDTLAYLDLDRLITATGASASGFCTACLTGSYPVDVPLQRARLEDLDRLPEVDLVHPAG
ncbi:MAG: amidophosphoribosyltransferase [Acidimicrobiales bacterium]